LPLAPLAPHSLVYAHSMSDLAARLDQLATAAGPADPVPSADGWELVLAQNIAYLVDDQRRWQALAELRRQVGLAPEQILAAPEPVLAGIVAGARPAERVQRQSLPQRRSPAAAVLTRPPG
jgi:hypothetical protein